MHPDQRIAQATAELRAVLNDTVDELKTERTRRRGGLQRRLHELRRMLDPGYAYTSQAGQDAVVDRIFGGRRGLTFADIGGYDGVTGSNTFFLEQRRGWTGLLVEPVPAQLALARMVRRCDCLPYAVAGADGEAEFLEVAEGYTQMSGLAGSYDSGLLAQVRADPRHKERTLHVETRTLSRLLTEAGLPNPDFVSLDIEGGEEAALAAFPFERHRIGVWAIENNTGAPAIGRIMRAAGHDLVEFCGPDELWMRRGLSE
ncbi:FkbM family methyltransferase [Rubellimicrobium rubrum]|uniref:FkbM family methyltransferase n=1 Tax=Rubellimicrobium rubrum TaxID=2585369 RepID=A0A5C4N4Q4_9RHOB|nr:FkbM family methyltransferase [Rubellimicrobium rubrum]TNC51586.1 FkbM family methyltransferase [Rubellimicrobium rubrum]